MGLGATMGICMTRHGIKVLGVEPRVDEVENILDGRVYTTWFCQVDIPTKSMESRSVGVTINNNS
jgi:hypothetical protein